MSDRSNIVLIGMPGAGKSTVGVILAKRTSRDFIDTDVVIQTQQGCTLQDIVDVDGYDVLREIEETALLGLSLINHVIATGGSAVYSEKAMEYLKAGSITVFLDADLSTLEERVKDFSTRGLAKSPEQSFSDLFDERLTLYRKYADIIIPCANLTQDEVCNAIAAAIHSHDH